MQIGILTLYELRVCCEITVGGKNRVFAGIVFSMAEASRLHFALKQVGLQMTKNVWI